jgi:hypothetical protein
MFQCTHATTACTLSVVAQYMHCRCTCLLYNVIPAGQMCITIACSRYVEGCLLYYKLYTMQLYKRVHIVYMGIHRVYMGISIGYVGIEYPYTHSMVYK